MVMQSLQETYESARLDVSRAAEMAAWEADRAEHTLDYLRMLVKPHGLGVEMRAGKTDAQGERWYHVTLTTPSGGRCVVGQVRETTDLTLESLHVMVGCPFFVRSVDTLAAQVIAANKRDERAGAIWATVFVLLLGAIAYGYASM